MALFRVPVAWVFRCLVWFAALFGFNWPRVQPNEEPIALAQAGPEHQTRALSIAEARPDAAEVPMSPFGLRLRRTAAIMATRGM
jgi:hypothetical protein